MGGVIVKVISGGQTGVDQGGLIAAKLIGIPTGGWAPRGYLTENGPNNYLAEFGLSEHSSDKYPPRTARNIHESDATLIMAHDFDRGSGLTVKLCRSMKKPFMTITDEPDLNNRIMESVVDSIVEWIKARHRVLGRGLVLNIAGNRESRAPGIQVRSSILFHKVFSKIESPSV
jgi:hypothetical protein